MKRIFSTLCLALLSLTALADEGMWLPSLISSRIDDMRAKGFQLTAEDIYSINKASLKDAVMLFDDGCTAELISPEGLLITNHHCGYGAIQRLSSVEHDYLTDGFWAQSREEELPNENLNVKFLKRMEDITERLAAGESREEILEKARENGRYKASIEQMYYGNQQFLFVYEQFDDVRLVGAPHSSIGKFGGETDNWMWPRHTGDFSIFRIYAGKDNRPAEYSEENVPYKAEEFLKVSLDGYKADDFTMIMGFPGSTERYMTSYEIDEMFQVSGPQRIDIRGARQDILKEDMAASDKVRIQYASKYANSSNYWKNTIGMLRGLKKLDVKALKEAQEAEFQAWAEQNTLPEEGFVDALGMIREAVNDNMAYTGPLQYLSEAMVRSVEIMTPALVANPDADGRGGKRRSESAGEGVLRQLLQGLQPADGPQGSPEDAFDGQGEREGSADRFRGGDRRAVRRRHRRLCGLPVRQFGLHGRGQGIGRYVRADQERSGGSVGYVGSEQDEGAAREGRTQFAEICGRTSSLRSRSDAHAARQGLVFGCELHHSSDLRSGVAL